MRLNIGATATARHGGMKCNTHKLYSFTCDDYDALRARANGRCEACGRPEDMSARNGKLFLDHDHRYGPTAVRGLICGRCNSYLGRIESPNVWRWKWQSPISEFSDYLSRAWFVHGTSGTRPENAPAVDHAAVKAAMLAWEERMHLGSRPEDFAVVPVSKPAEAARILRAAFSPQGFTRLLRALIVDDRELGARVSIPAQRPADAARILRNNLTPSDLARLIRALTPAETEPEEQR